MHPTTFLAALAITLPTLVSALPQGPPAGSPGAFSSPEDVKEPHCYEQAGEAPIPADFTDQCEKTKRDPWIDLTFKGSDGADWRFKFVTTQYDNKGAVLPKCSDIKGDIQNLLGKCKSGGVIIHKALLVRFGQLVVEKVGGANSPAPAWVIGPPGDRFNNPIAAEDPDK